MQKKRNITQYLDALVDKDGLRTELTITITTTTLLRLSLMLLLTGISLMLIAKVIRHRFPNTQLSSIVTNLKAMKKHIINS